MTSLDLVVAAGAALAFAVVLRVRFYLLLGDGLMLAGGLFFAYLLVAALLRG
ncbi:hypothetical protein GCM10012287_46590 [Streptomyces daqingensis]|uniref:Uncharacterized protein n=1 Tax=Streptomyces daqingensis TaxID=1472640 RepID=A0ABQ2MMP0_9ACTN|nr:hypothetical protein [Streptomyces daqingensis]GGO55402.1 hypothetical protein GCM10012287_46590 [Streptomyces daqingensis]